MNTLTLFKAESLLSLDREHEMRISRAPSYNPMHKSTSDIRTPKQKISGGFFSRQLSRPSSPSSALFSSRDSSRASSPLRSGGMFSKNISRNSSPLRRVVSTKDQISSIRIDQSYSEHSENSLDVTTRRKTRSETKQMSVLERSLSARSPDQSHHKKVSNVERVFSQRTKRAAVQFTETNVSNQFVLSCCLNTFAK